MSRVRVQSAVIFCASVFLGILFSRAYHRLKGVSKEIVRWTSDIPHEDKYKAFLDSRQLKQTWSTNKSHFQVMKEAEYLQNTVTVLCAVVLQKSKNNKYMKSDAVQKTSALEALKDTWVPRCNKVIYFSHEGINSIILKSESLDQWEAWREMLSHLFRAKYTDKFDWFLYAEQDTFVIMENLRYYLSVYDAAEPHFLGHAYESWGSSYNAAGPGVVLSKGAMRKLHTAILKGHCSGGGSAEFELGRCLEDVGVSPSDTRDFQGRARFLMYQPEFLLVPEMLPAREKYWSYSKFLSKEGPDCCSDYAVSFHFVPPNMMYVFNYLVYHLQPYGISEQLLLPLHPPNGTLQTNRAHQSHSRTQTVVVSRDMAQSSPAVNMQHSRVRTTFESANSTHEYKHVKGHHNPTINARPRMHNKLKVRN